MRFLSQKLKTKLLHGYIFSLLLGGIGIRYMWNLSSLCLCKQNPTCPFCLVLLSYDRCFGSSIIDITIWPLFMLYSLHSFLQLYRGISLMCLLCSAILFAYFQFIIFSGSFSLLYVAQGRKHSNPAAIISVLPCKFCQELLYCGGINVTTFVMCIYS